MARYVVLAAAAFLSVLSSASLATAQQNVLAELYGRGVHAYFAGDYEKAHELLTEAIEAGTQDPRAFYFRGLTYYMTGRPEDATDDFKTAAQFEVESRDRVYDVSRALQRIQGSIRLTIEEHRQDARLAARQAAARRARARYEQFQRSQEGAVIGPTERLTIPPRTAPGDDAPPAGDEAPPAGDEAPPVNDPFAPEQDVPAVTPEPATDATDSGAADPEATDAAPGDAQPAPQDDPFGGLPDAGGDAAPPAQDPFGNLEATAPDAGADAAPPTNDPFGNLDAAAPDAAAPDAVAPDGGADAAAPGTDEGAAAAPSGNGNRRGALGGLFRAFRNSMPQPPAIPGVGGVSPALTPPVEEEGPADPFAPPIRNQAPAESEAGDSAPPANDPFAPPQ